MYNVYRWEHLYVCVCLCCSVAVKNTTSLSTAVCRIVHTVSEGSGGLLRETSDYSGGCSCCRGLSLPSFSHALMQLLLVVSLWYYQLRLLLKHTTHRQEAGSLQEAVSRQWPVSPPGKRQCGTPLESSWPTKRSRCKEKVNSCVFFFFFLSFSPLHNKK